MALTEENRHRLYQRLEQVLGREEATTLMEHLPPVGWADVATKRDVDHLGAELRAELRADIERGLRVQLMTVLAFNLSMVGAVAALLR